MATEQLEKSSAGSGPLHARADQSVLHHSGIQECTDEFQQPPDFIDDLINQLTPVDEQRKHRQTHLGSPVENWLGIRAVLNVCRGLRARRLLQRASGLLLVSGVACLVFWALADRHINQTHRIARTTISVDKEQAIVPADQKQSIVSTDQKQSMVPADREQPTVPANRKQSIASIDQEQAMLRADQEQFVVPADKEQSIVPAADQKQSITPSDKQQAIDTEDKQEAIVPDKQQTIATDDKQQAAISRRSMHDAPAEERSSYNLTSTPPDATIEPVKNSALVPPDRNTVVPANDGGYVVQVSAERSDAKAQASFKTLQSRYPHVLGGRSPLIRRVKLGEKGIFYRAQIGPFDTVEQAKRLCARLKSAGGQCMVQKQS